MTDDNPVKHTADTTAESFEDHLKSLSEGAGIGVECPECSAELIIEAWVSDRKSALIGCENDHLYHKGFMDDSHRG